MHDSAGSAAARRRAEGQAANDCPRKPHWTRILEGFNSLAREAIWALSDLNFGALGLERFWLQSLWAWCWRDALLVAQPRWQSGALLELAWNIWPRRRGPHLALAIPVLAAPR